MSAQVRIRVEQRFSSFSSFQLDPGPRPVKNQPQLDSET